jgi:hypothetical protein
MLEFVASLQNLAIILTKLSRLITVDGNAPSTAFGVGLVNGPSRLHGGVGDFRQLHRRTSDGRRRASTSARSLTTA